MNLQCSGFLTSLSFVLFELSIKLLCFLRCQSNLLTCVFLEENHNEVRPKSVETRKFIKMPELLRKHMANADCKCNVKVNIAFTYLIRSRGE